MEFALPWRATCKSQTHYRITLSHVYKDLSYFDNADVILHVSRFDFHLHIPWLKAGGGSLNPLKAGFTCGGRSKSKSIVILQDHIFNHSS